MKPHEYRQIVEGVCRVCGTPFKGLKTKRYCSNACNCKAKRDRKQRK